MTPPLNDREILAKRRAGATVSALSREYGVSWNRISAAVAAASLETETMVGPSVRIPGQCHDCRCHSHAHDFEIQPLTAALIRKPGTCRRVA